MHQSAKGWISQSNRCIVPHPKEAYPNRGRVQPAADDDLLVSAHVFGSGIQRDDGSGQAGKAGTMRRQKALLELRSGGSDRRSLIELLAGTRGRFRRCVVALAIVVATLAAVALPVGFAPPAGAAAPPVVTGVSPNSGPLTAGNLSRLPELDSPERPRFILGTTGAGFIVKSDTRNSATAPAGTPGRLT